MIVPELVLVPLAGRKWRVDRAFAIDTEAAGLVVIKAGFICDLNSMPRAMWWESTPTDYPEAGATHDWLYYLQVAKDVADRVYLEILLALGMGSFRAHARYYALRVFGGWAYRSHAKHAEHLELV